MLRPIDNYFLQQDEPTKSCLHFLRTYMLTKDECITECWKYRMPFYCYNDRMLCYLWVHKKYKQPYIGFVDGKNIHHPDLIVEKRARMKILLIDPTKDIPIEKMDDLLNVAIAFYK
jgi:hypothetical protein